MISIIGYKNENNCLKDLANVLYEPCALLHEKIFAELVTNTKNCDTRHDKSYFGQRHGGTWKIIKNGPGSLDF